MSSQAKNRQGRTKTKSSSSAGRCNAVIIFYVHQAERITRWMDDNRTDRQPYMDDNRTDHQPYMDDGRTEGMMVERKG